MASLSDIKFRDTFTIPILHPVTGEAVTTDDGKLMTVTVYGSDTRKYRQALADASGAHTDPVERAAAVLGAVTKEWTVQLDPGEGVADVDRAADAYLAHDWLREAVDLAVHRRANFFVGASAD